MDDAAALLASNLRRIRIHRQWSVEQTAHVTGLHSALIDGIENGRSFLGRRSIERLAARLEVPVTQLTTAPRHQA